MEWLPSIQINGKPMAIIHRRQQIELIDALKDAKARKRRYNKNVPDYIVELGVRYIESEAAATLCDCCPNHLISEFRKRSELKRPIKRYGHWYYPEDGLAVIRNEPSRRGRGGQPQLIARYNNGSWDFPTRMVAKFWFGKDTIANQAKVSKCGARKKCPDGSPLHKEKNLEMKGPPACYWNGEDTIRYARSIGGEIDEWAQRFPLHVPSSGPVNGTPMAVLANGQAAAPKRASADEPSAADIAAVLAKLQMDESTGLPASDDFWHPDQSDDFWHHHITPVNLRQNALASKNHIRKWPDPEDKRRNKRNLYSVADAIKHWPEKFVDLLKTVRGLTSLGKVA